MKMYIIIIIIKIKDKPLLIPQVGNFDCYSRKWKVQKEEQQKNTRVQSKRVFYSDNTLL